MLLFLLLLALSGASPLAKRNLLTCSGVWSCFLAASGSTNSVITAEQAGVILQTGVSTGCRQWPTAATGEQFVSVYAVNGTSTLTEADFTGSALVCRSSKSLAMATNFCRCINPEK